MQQVNIFWFRRDLRFNDNCGLFNALNSGLPVVPVFLFDKMILNQFPDPDDARLTFIHQTVSEMKRKLNQTGRDLMVFFATPEGAFARLIQQFPVHAVYANTDYEPQAIARDQKIGELLQQKSIGLHLFKDQVIFHHNEIVKSDGNPYTVFTPYSKAWKNKLAQNPIHHYDSEDLLNRILPMAPTRLPALDEIGYKPMKVTFPKQTVDPELLRNYQQTRDFPALNGTSKLSIHLRFGTISIRRLTVQALQHSETFLNELIWRNFYMDILWHFPQVEHNAFKPAYDKIEWRNNEAEFVRWCNGETGFPLVDAGMRELNQTGYMHNRVRMVVASFLTKHLLIDWRWGEAYFAQKLHDFDLAANNGGWQWASGSGCDAAPYFRVFNPDLQTQKFDPDLKYICRWVPEFGSFSYPRPLVDHAFARNRALEVYKKGLNDSL
jgi:deoxyribodipyrimidine photo-lyase